jgi:hypothetical protein
MSCSLVRPFPLPLPLPLPSPCAERAGSDEPRRIAILRAIILADIKLKFTPTKWGDDLYALVKRAKVSMLAWRAGATVLLTAEDGACCCRLCWC